MENDKQTTVLSKLLAYAISPTVQLAKLKAMITKDIQNRLETIIRNIEREHRVINTQKREAGKDLPADQYQRWHYLLQKWRKRDMTELRALLDELNTALGPTPKPDIRPSIPTRYIHASRRKHPSK